MVDQTTMNGRSRAARLGRNVSDYAHDVVTLAELQLRLLSVDVRDGARAAGPAGALIVAGSLAALGSIALLFVAMALALAELTGWPHSVSFAISAVVGLAAGGILAYLGWKKLVSAGKTLGRSKAEFVETLKWIKESLRPSEDDEGITLPPSRF